MQNVAQGTTSDCNNQDKQSVQEKSSTTTSQSSTSSPTKSETETSSEPQPRYMSDSSGSEDSSEVN